MRKFISLIFTYKTIYYIVIFLLIIAIFFSLPSKAILNAINNKIIRPLNNITIVLDPGHGGIDGGTSFNDILEKNINLSIGFKIRDVLIKRGATVIITREIDDSLDDHINNGGSRHREDLKARVKVVNENKVDIFVSIHVNHAKNKNKIGPIIFYNKDREESKKLAVYMQDYLNNLSAYNKLDGYIKHDVTSGKYYTLSNIMVPGVIVEMGFISNEIDRELLLNDEHQDEIADLIARSIITYIHDDREDR